MRKTTNQTTNQLALFLPSLCGGGAERVMVNLANGFRSRGYEVDMVLAWAKGPFLKELDPKVRVVDLKCRHVSTSLIKLMRYLRRERPQALLSSLAHASITVLMAKVLTRSPTRIIVSVHSMKQEAGSVGMTLKTMLLSRMVRFLYPIAERVVAVSHGIAADIIRHFPTLAPKVLVIYNPVITPSLFSKSQEPLNHAWFLPEHPPVLLGVGRLDFRKDFPTLIHAFSRVQERIDARLIILGDGIERERLEALVVELGIQKTVQLIGFQENPYPFFLRSSVFVLSSRWEGMPTVLVEALALGTPVVSTRCPSGPEEILSGKGGERLVGVGDEAALAEAIIETLETGPNQRPLPRLDSFHIDFAVDAYLEIML